MKELIKIDENQKVLASELHEFLELDKNNYSKWIKNNIISNTNAREGYDFSYLSTKNTDNKHGRPKQDYLLTIDFAKKLCMISNSKKGEECRDYFIEVEKRFKQIIQPRTEAELLLEAFNILQRKVENEKIAHRKTKEKLIEEKRFKQEVFESNDLLTVSQSAKILGTGRDKLFKFFKDYGYIINSHEPYQRYMDAGYFKVKETKKDLGETHRVFQQIFLTQKGLAFFRKKLEQKQLEFSDYEYGY